MLCSQSSLVCVCGWGSERPRTLPGRTGSSVGGEELAMVEAMKMENVLRAERDAVIASIEAEPGDGLEVDQTILTFE